MCRSTINGGRRCPSHSDPTAVANRNARRRAAYQKRKGLDLPPETTHVGKPVPASATSASLTHPLFAATMNDKTGDKLYSFTGEQKAFEDLNVTASRVEGELVDANYLASTVVDGVINYNNLNEKSYTAFGFKEIHDDRDNVMDSLNPHLGRDVSVARFEENIDLNAKLSRDEMQGLTPAERQSLRFFTGSEYKWVNASLYGEEALVKDREDLGDYFVGSTLEENHYHYTYWADRTPARLKELTRYMDAALAKGPKKQRILYRGMSTYNKAFNNVNAPSDEKAATWVDENISLGQELVFDGYQSATNSEKIAAQYAGDSGGIIYQILTSEGVNVTSVSEYDREQETILPRDARYMVVGVQKGVKIARCENMSVVQLVAIDGKGAVLNSEHSHTPQPLKENQMRIVDEKN